MPDEIQPMPKPDFIQLPITGIMWRRMNTFGPFIQTIEEAVTYIQDVVENCDLDFDGSPIENYP